MELGIGFWVLGALWLLFYVFVKIGRRSLVSGFFWISSNRAASQLWEILSGFDTGTWRLEPWPVGATADRGEGRGGADCRVCAAAGDLWLRLGGNGGQFAGQMGGFSHESEHDLAVMVSDFLENGSGGGDSRCSSDSDSGFSDLAHLAETISVSISTSLHFSAALLLVSIQLVDMVAIRIIALIAIGRGGVPGKRFGRMYYKHNVEQRETNLLLAIQSFMLTINETDLHDAKAGPCNASCIRQMLVKLLRLSDYDAAVCISKWQGLGKVPGGDHEYIEVTPNGSNGISERLIVDIDFRSHFEIARAVESYDKILKSLPVVYVGTLTRLKQFLQVMVEAARSSLKQNSMPLPPWRSLAYLTAKWQSSYERKLSPDGQMANNHDSSDHKLCIGHLRRLKSSLQSEIETERLLKPIINENITNNNNRRVKLDRRRQHTHWLRS
ncbi:hypothetical protein ACLOJK_012836 [Asimina triloba]